MWETYPFKENEVVAFKTSVCFVDSVAELFGTLGGGATVCTFPPSLCADPEALVRLTTVSPVCVEMLAQVEALRGAGITRITVTPSLLSSLLQVYRSSLCDQLPGASLARPLVLILVFSARHVDCKWRGPDK